MKKKRTKEEAINWIIHNFPNFELIQWGESAMGKSIFKDLIRNIPFEISFTEFKHSLKKNKNHLFAASKEEIKNKVKQTNLENYGVEFPIQREDFKNKRAKTNIEKYGVENVTQSKQIQEKIKQTNLERYGFKSSFQNKEIKEKIKQINLERYGVENPFQNKEIKEKIKQTNIERYGFENPNQNKKIKEKAKQTCLKRYGFENPIQNTETKNKAKQTNIKKFGVENVGQNQEIQEKIKQTKIKSGHTKTINGKTLAEIAIEKQCGYTTLQKLSKGGYSDEFISDFKVGKTGIEQIIETSLKESNINYVYNKSLGDNRYRPDFLIEDHKLIIECDGLYWHSERNERIDKNYHKVKKDYCQSLGYNSLFFRANEIQNKPNIVKSIIQNKLGLSKRIFARKCKIKIIYSSNYFFEENHLMGAGSGRSYGLFLNDELIAGIQVKWKKISNKQLEVSRFCTLNGTSVIGGFSKLLKHVVEIERPKQIITFIDKRYGDGSYLEQFGFKKETEHQSFVWTDFEKTFHRLNFPGNSGYERGFFKLWDCGQAKWVKNI